MPAMNYKPVANYKPRERGKRKHPDPEKDQPAPKKLCLEEENQAAAEAVSPVNEEDRHNQTDLGEVARRLASLAIESPAAESASEASAERHQGEYCAGALSDCPCGEEVL